MENKLRKPWIAGLLSLIQPGLGQVYNGQIAKALIVYLLPILAIPGLMLCLKGELVRIILISYAVLGLAYYIIVTVDAVRTAKSFINSYDLKKYNKLIVYIGIYVSAAIFSTSLSSVIKSKFIHAYKLPSGTMEPTLLIGDHILIDRTPSAREPHRGDVIVFEFPEDPKKDFIKRVVAVGGDTVEIRNKELFVNGNAAAEPYVVHKEPDMVPASVNPRDNFGPKLVPASSYFVLGDNRDRSYDSRFWGSVPNTKVKGTVKSIYWSWDREKFAVRWNRIGVAVPVHGPTTGVSRQTAAP
jgi:signal peptidase I